MIKLRLWWNGWAWENYLLENTIDLNSVTENSLLGQKSTVQYFSAISASELLGELWYLLIFSKIKVFN